MGEDTPPKPLLPPPCSGPLSKSSQSCPHRNHLAATPLIGDDSPSVPDQPSIPLPDDPPSNPPQDTSSNNDKSTSSSSYGTNISYVVKTFISGGIAGMCSKTSTAPIDRLKILLQVHHKAYTDHSIFNAFRAVYRNEGFLGYYKGNGAMMVRVFPYAAIQFMSFEQYKRLLKPHFSERNMHFSKLLAGSMTGVTAVTFTYPLDLVRARLAYQVSERKYTGVFKALVMIPREEGGLIALYRGYTASIMGMIPYAGIAFYTYELIKSILLETTFLQPYTSKKSMDKSGTVVLNIPSNLFAGGMAGALSQSISYPLDVCRRHMQLEAVRSENPNYPNVFSLLAKIYRTSGLTRGLYRGMTLNFYRAIPQVAVSFSVYEFMKQLFGISKPV